MDRIAALIDAAILDTSWLLELYQVPGSSDASRIQQVRTETAKLVNDKVELLVTAPVLFEVANHIVRAGDGRRRRSLGEKLRDDIKSSLDREMPWTISAFGPDILLRSQDVIQLAERFAETSGPNYSFADISVISLTETLREAGKKVKILAFDKQLEAYSD